MSHACSRTIVHCNFNRANNRDVSSPAKQFRFEPRSINMGRTAVRRVPDTAGILANMTIGSRRQFAEQPRLLPLKAGVQGLQSADMFI